MADLEKVHIKLGLSGTYWDKRPQYRVSFNEQVIKEAQISTESEVVEYIEFDVEYSTDTGVLKVELLNKSSEDTVQSEDKSEILKDMLLNIISVEVDEINLEKILHSQSIYTTEDKVFWNDKETTVITECLNLGWNGTWALTWANPFYIWLLENM